MTDDGARRAEEPNKSEQSGVYFVFIVFVGSGVGREALQLKRRYSLTSHMEYNKK